MASRSTVSLKPLGSQRCFMVCQQNLVVELYYGSRTDLGSRLTLSGFERLYLCDSMAYIDV